MPHHDYYSRRGAYSPPSSATYSDPYDRHDRYPPPRDAVQPYYPANGHRRDLRAVGPYDDGGHVSPRKGAVARRRRSDGSLESASQSKSQQAQTWFKDHGAELIGAAAGGYAGRKRGDDPLTTASGAAVGAIGGKIVDRQYRKWNDKRQDKKVGHAVRHGNGREMDISSDEYDEPEPRYSRSVGGRSRSRGRERGRSESRGREKSPQTWKDLAGQIRRELSRKREKSRPRSDYSDYSR